MVSLFQLAHGNHRNHREGNDTGADFTVYESPELYPSASAENILINEEKRYWSNISFKVCLSGQG